MELLTSEAIHFTPPVEQLLPFTQMRCTQVDCVSVFTNAGNLEMHLQKHHKCPPSIVQQKSKDNRLFHCPEQSCIYNVSRKEGKHFRLLKYLRQHYQKMHATKSQICQQCDKHFATPGLLKSHQLHACGKKFTCMQCGWQYDTRETLLSHERRKGHRITHAKPPKIAIPRLKTIRESPKIYNQHRETQTEVAKHLEANFAQTAAIQCNFDVHDKSDMYSTNEAVDLHLISIETQTEFPYSSSNAALLDQMLAPYTHMHTQTCDDFLSELGLADIQTQTNWSSFQDDAAVSPAGAHDELLVSTETQTSFTQLLLDSCSATATHEGSDGSTFSGLYMTQHTQTCETLLEGLFGAQESDLMGTFQSTYTQT